MSGPHFVRTQFFEQLVIEAHVFERQLWHGDHAHPADALKAWCLARFDEVWGGRHHSHGRYVRKGIQYHEVVATTAPICQPSRAEYKIDATVAAMVFQPTDDPLRAVCTEFIDELNTVRAVVYDPESKEVMLHVYVENLPPNHGLQVNQTISVQVLDLTENELASAHLNVIGRLHQLEGQHAKAETQAKPLVESAGDLRQKVVDDQAQTGRRDRHRRNGAPIDLVSNQHDRAKRNGNAKHSKA
jgi:hypothetical protein